MYAFKMGINKKDIALNFYCTGPSHHFTLPGGECFCKMIFCSLSLEVHLFVNQPVAIFLPPPPGHSSESIQVTLIA